MEISPEDAAGTSEIQGETFYLCSPVCKENFDTNPAEFAGKSAITIETVVSTNGGSNEPLKNADVLSGRRNNNSTPNGDGERVDLPITGMTCAACANRIEKQLKKQTGVDACSVNFATSKATINYDPEKTNVSDLIQTVKDTGYDTAGTGKIEFVVDDSARPSGSSVPIEERLLKMRGVIKANFNLATMEISVEYLPSAADTKAIRAKIEDLGYRVREVKGTGAAEEDSLEAAHGINLITLLWTDGVRCVPVDYRVFDKDTDGKTKNDHFAEMLLAASEREFSLGLVCFDIWYGSVVNLKLVRSLGWHFLTRLKADRQIRVGGSALQAVSSAGLTGGDGTICWLKGFREIKVFRVRARCRHIGILGDESAGNDQNRKRNARKKRVAH